MELVIDLINSFGFRGQATNMACLYSNVYKVYQYLFFLVDGRSK